MDDDRQAPDERELVVAVARGDRQAFAQLFDRHAVPAQRMLLQLGVAETAVGAALHDVFLAFWRAAPRMDPAVPIRAQLLAFAMLQRRGGISADVAA